MRIGSWVRRWLDLALWCCYNTRMNEPLSLDFAVIMAAIEQIMREDHAILRALSTTERKR